MVSFLDHPVRFEVHWGMSFYVIAFVYGTCEVDGIVFIAMYTEYLLGFGLDLSYVVHQLPPVGMT